MWRLGRRRRRTDDVHKCILKTCDKPSVPQEGPFCKEHNWDDVQQEMDTSRRTDGHQD